jgi:hypothetical protein
MTVRISYDEAKTWATESLIHEGWSCYSCLAALADGKIGLLYEAGTKARYESINFVRMKLQELSGGKDQGDSSRAQ